MSERSLDLPGEPDDVPRARRFVRETLSADGLGVLGDDADLVTSEIVTNALPHAAPPVRVVVASGGDRARVTVYDGSQLTPVRSRPDEEAMTGCGPP